MRRIQGVILSKSAYRKRCEKLRKRRRKNLVSGYPKKKKGWRKKLLVKAYFALKALQPKVPR